MKPDMEHYRSACQMISALTNLEVLVFDAENALQLHVALYELPDVLEQLRTHCNTTFPS